MGDDGTIKLADFGLSIDTCHEPANTRLGTQVGALMQLYTILSA